MAPRSHHPARSPSETKSEAVPLSPLILCHPHAQEGESGTEEQSGLRSSVSPLDFLPSAPDIVRGR